MQSAPKFSPSNHQKISTTCSSLKKLRIVYNPKIIKKGKGGILAEQGEAEEVCCKNYMLMEREMNILNQYSEKNEKNHPGKIMKK